MIGVERRRSSIEGFGLFATRRFRAGSVVVRLTEKEVHGFYSPNEVPEAPMMLGVGIGQWQQPKLTTSWRWLNHSCTPNIGFRTATTLIALKDIAVGEEVLLDYSMAEGDPWWTMGCACGSKKCRKTLQAFQFLPSSLQRAYRPVVAPWIQEIAQRYVGVSREIGNAAVAMLSGAVIAFPTESFFALGVAANDRGAIQELFHLKRREAGKPIALIAADLEQVEQYFYLSPTERRLAKQHWPGPLTMLLRPKNGIDATALGAAKIGVRVPSHALARKLAKAVGAPITATSANRSGEAPTKEGRVVKDVFPDILVVEGSCGKKSTPSTIIDIRGAKVHIIRQGSVHV